MSQQNIYSFSVVLPDSYGASLVPVLVQTLSHLAYNNIDNGYKT
jgi:hypothetical protein